MQESGINTEIMLAVFGALLLVLKIAESLVRRKIDAGIKEAISDFNKSLSEQNKILGIIEGQSREILNMHSKFDSNGTPIWYVPRAWADTQKEILKICQDSSQTMKIIDEKVRGIQSKIPKKCQ